MTPCQYGHEVARQLGLRDLPADMGLLRRGDLAAVVQWLAVRTLGLTVAPEHHAEFVDGACDCIELRAALEELS